MNRDIEFLREIAYRPKPRKLTFLEAKKLMNLFSKREPIISSYIEELGLKNLFFENQGLNATHLLALDYYVREKASQLSLPFSLIKHSSYNTSFYTKFEISPEKVSLCAYIPSCREKLWSLIQKGAELRLTGQNSSFYEDGNPILVDKISFVFRENFSRMSIQGSYGSSSLTTYFESSYMKERHIKSLEDIQTFYEKKVFPYFSDKINKLALTTFHLPEDK